MFAVNSILLGGVKDPVQNFLRRPVFWVLIWPASEFIGICFKTKKKWINKYDVRYKRNDLNICHISAISYSLTGSLGIMNVVQNQSNWWLYRNKRKFYWKDDWWKQVMIRRNDRQYSTINGLWACWTRDRFVLTTSDTGFFLLWTLFILCFNITKLFRGENGTF